MYVQSVLYEPVDDAAGVKSADPVGVEGDKELCVQNVLYEPVDGAAGVAGAKMTRNCVYRMYFMNLQTMTLVWRVLSLWV